jgi:hypothetical protein
MFSADLSNVAMASPLRSQGVERTGLSQFHDGSGRDMITTTVSKMHPTTIRLPDRTRIEMIDLLNARLAESLDLGLQARHAHWNIRGPQFAALHDLFARSMRIWIDTPTYSPSARCSWAAWLRALFVPSETDRVFRFVPSRLRDLSTSGASQRRCRHGRARCGAPSFRHRSSKIL